MSKKKIAAVCAYPSQLNPGMLSVDLALEHVLRELPHDVEVTKFCAEQAFHAAGRVGELKYEHLHSASQLEGFDHILYWGDFLHWIGYARRDFVGRQRLRDKDPEDAWNLWYQCMLLEGRPDLQKRAIVFGSTIYGLTARQLGTQRYMDALSSLYANAVLVQLRDVLSAGFAQQVSGSGRSMFGCDCAFLLDTAGWSDEKPRQEPYAVQAFGRSGSSLILQAFTANLSHEAEVPVQAMKWFSTSGIDGLEKKLAWIRHARFVITDIYHVAVTALRERTPVLCCGWGASAIETSLSDKKKEVLMTQHLLSEGFVFLEDLAQAMRSDRASHELAQRLAKTAKDEALYASAFDLARRHAHGARDRLLAALVE